MTTNNNIAASATSAEDLLSYLKGAQVGAKIMQVNLRGAADIDDQMAPMDFVVESIHGLLGELIEDLVEKMEENDAIDQAIEDWNAQESDRQEAEAYAEAEASMREAAGAAVVEAINDKGLNMMYNPGALAEALASDSDELLDSATWAAVNLDLAAHGFVLNVLWVSRYEILERERSALISGCPGAVSANIIWLREEHFWGKGKDLVRFMQAEAARLDADIIAGEFSPEQMFYVGLEIGWGEGDAYGLRIGFRKDDGSFKVTMI